MRATRVEEACSQICREAGGRVRRNVRVSDMNVAAQTNDERRVEILCSGLQCFGGAQLAIDATLRSAVGCNGEHRANCDWKDGAALDEAEVDKHMRYSDISASSRCKLIVVGIETGGRFSQTTTDLLRQLAGARAQSAPRYLRKAAGIGLERRWGRLLACASARSFIESLLFEKAAFAASSELGRRPPGLTDIVVDARRDVVLGTCC